MKKLIIRNHQTDCLFKGKKRAALLVLLLLVFSIGLWGCVFDEPDEESGSDPETESAAAEEQNTADVTAENENETETEAEAAPPENSPQADHGDLPTFNGHFYEFVDQPMSWTAARDYCGSAGGHLVTITSPEEQEFIEKNFSKWQFWIGAYSNGVYGGDIYDWRWVTEEKWYYENFGDGEPSNSSGEEWFGCTWKNMKWNDLREGDPGNRLGGFVCEYDDLKDLYETGGGSGSGSNSGKAQSDPPEMNTTESESDWAEALQKSTEEDPHYKDLGGGRTAIQSHWRGVQIKYPDDYYAAEDGDALYVTDGGSMYLYARNITSAAEENGGDLAAFCAAKAEDQAVRDFTRLYGKPTNFDRIEREGGDGSNRVCAIRGNMWNDNADMAFSSKVFVSGKQKNFLVQYTALWEYGDETARSHTGNIDITSWGKGDMYGQ